MAPTPSVQSSPPAQARPASFVLAPYRWAVVDLPATTPASTCATGADGTEAAPSFAPSASASPGWWTGLLCAYGHTSWSTLSIKANRSLTLEVTAQDELGSATILKAMPVIGLWNVTDARGTIPTVAATPAPFNGTAYGMSTLSLQSAQPRQFRIAIADQRGDGRPDFSYQARALYADSISPATISAAGGVVTITGMGFRPGNAVTVNGVAATVSSWSATSIVATVPSLHTLHSTEALIANVAVNDLVTGGTTVMSSALTYAAPQPSLNLIAAPSGTVFVGDTAATPFSVQVLNGDGVTPIPGQAVVISASGASVRLGSCGTPTCTLLTDASGTASTSAAASTHSHSAAAETAHTPTNSIDPSLQATGPVQPQVQTAATTTPAVGPLTVTPATGGTVPLSGLALEIAASAKNGKSSFEIRLDPADLGRIDVRIDVDRNGQMTSHLTVEKPETLSMLQQDAPQLQRALNDAGFKTGDSGLQFSLRDQSSSGQNSGNQSGNNAQRLVISDDDTVPAVLAGRTYGRSLGSSSGVDISV